MEQMQRVAPHGTHSQHHDSLARQPYLQSRSGTVFDASELESTMRLQRRTPKLPIRSLTPFPHSGNLDDAPKTLHVLKPFSAVTCGIAMLAGVDREFLKSDTIGPSGGVLSGLRVLERMIQNNPSNLMRVIPTKGARWHLRFPRI